MVDSAESAKAGRPQKVSQSEKKHLALLISLNRAKNAAEAARLFNANRENKISVQTVRRVLKEYGLKAKKIKKKPAISKKNKWERLKWARKHREWTVEDWKRVIWSDETKINRFGSDGNKYAWVKDGANLQPREIEPTVKFGGGSVMVWGCMTWAGVGYAARIEGTMDGPLYVKILRDCLLPTLEACMLMPEFPPYNQLYFQQDNDSKHTSGAAKDFFSGQGFKVLQWPSNSPDLNPIEHLWHILKRALYTYQEPAKGVFELWERVQREWLKIKPETCQSLIESMPQRIKAVIAARGSQTKY